VRIVSTHFINMGVSLQMQKSEKSNSNIPEMSLYKFVARNPPTCTHNVLRIPKLI